MEPYQQKEIAEFSALRARIDELMKFSLEEYPRLSPEEVFLLNIQLDAMALLMNISDHRIKSWNGAR
jgi:hypothetical protein